MSAVLKHRRGWDEKDRDHDGLEEGQFRKERSNDDEEKSKQRGWRRANLWKKCTAFVVVIFICFLGKKAQIRNPKLPVLNVDIDVPDPEDWPLIHIVQSRFMQEQGPLETLGMARLKLFLAFCLPSMTRQSSQDFFWIIKTDPQFTKTSVFDMLVESVRQHDNIYVVASNSNFIFGSAGREGSWRDGKEALDLLKSKIYTGNVDKLKVAMALREERPVLETRLDADDGLHKDFIKYIQEVALKRFQPLEENRSNNKILVPKWLYWCSRRHIEWHSDVDRSLSEKQKADRGSLEFGYINIVQHDKLCVTPGVTIGYNRNLDNPKNPIDVPFYDHDKLYNNVRNSMSCYSDEGTNYDDKREVDDEIEKRGPCLELVEDFLFCAIRSRTWTSAGMYKIDLVVNDGNRKQGELTEKLWAVSEYAFGVTKSKVQETQDFLIRNKKRIAEENLAGQCSTGHSCKDSAKEKLKQIVDSENKER